VIRIAIQETEKLKFDKPAGKAALRKPVPVWLRVDWLAPRADESPDDGEVDDHSMSRP
jgi:hypothetical protein